jgi:hypothetical protein
MSLPDRLAPRSFHPANMQGQILAFTEQVAEQLAQECRDQPLKELEAWIGIAQQREAMVTRLYDLKVIESRLGDPARGTAADVIRKAIANLWVHEESHTRYLSALKRGAGLSGQLIEIVRGRLEGRITDSAARGGLFGRLGIALGVATGMAPDFSRELRAMTLRQFCLFCAELEETARRGYQRILELVAATRQAGVIDEYALSIREDVVRILAEEGYHAAVFETIVGWLEADGDTVRPLDAGTCVRALYALCDRLLAAGPARPRGDGGTPTAPGDDAGWISDGGLGPLFLEHGLAVRVS